MRIAVAQLNYTIGDFEGNKAQIVASIERAKYDGCDLVAFSEFAICGAPARAFLNQQSFLDSCQTALLEIAKASKGIDVLVGTPLSNDGVVYSGAAYISNGRIVNYISKKNVDFGDERAYMSSGLGCEYISVKGHSIAVALGHDMFDDEEYYAFADTVITMACDPYFRRRIPMRMSALRSWSYSKGKSVVLVNMFGANTDVIYDGSSCAFSASGEPILIMNSFSEDYAVVDLDAENQTVSLPEHLKSQNHFRAITLGISDFFRKNGYSKAGLVLTGGVDSAVVAALAVHALGKKNVIAMIPQEGFSNFHHSADARLVAEYLGIRYIDLEVDDVFQRMRATVENYTSIPLRTTEYMQARIANSFLMALYDYTGAIPLNSSNKTEIALNDGAIYGDFGGFLSPIGDLYKHDVYALAHFINLEREAIPEAILNRIPFAELRTQLFGGDVRISYDMLDAILYRFLEERQELDEVINAGFETDVAIRVLDRLSDSRTMRYQLAPVLRLTSYPFDKVSRQQPITARFDFAK